ncbi:MAG: thiamine diphosphokinase, partial [Clostridia bacterium]|nr:thiamine diphosphokinase [Clostridia bacterium]
MKKALIITGGYLNIKAVSVKPEDFDLILAADSGYLTADKLNIVPNIILGDFDSSAIPKTNAEILKVPAEKDETDTMLACTVAMERGATELLILGGTGGRADHFLSNLFLLESLSDKGITATLCDGENTIRVLHNKTT